MAFKSQAKQSRMITRRGSKAAIVVSQSYKPSTNSEELSLRLSADAISKMGLDMGERVDVLYDDENDMWMIQKSDNHGFMITGKSGAPTGLIRYTLKDGHARLTSNKEELPVRRESDDSSIKFDGSSVIFSLVVDD